MSATMREKNKRLLYNKLKKAEEAILMIMDERSFLPDDAIDLLLTDIQERLQGLRPCAGLDALQLEELYVNMIIGVMSQDLLDASDKLNLLMLSIKKRLQNFDLYFDQLEKGKMKRPFLEQEDV